MHDKARLVERQGFLPLFSRQFMVWGTFLKTPSLLDILYPHPHLLGDALA